MKSKIFKYIYALLMLMPAIAVGITCAYVVNNQNAKDSYYGETINESNNVSVDLNDLSVGSTVTYFLNPTTETTTSFDIYCSNLINNKTGNSINANRISVSTSSNTVYALFYLNSSYVSETNVTSYGINLTFSYQGNYNISSANTDLLNFTIVEYNSYSYLSEVFYYSVDKVENHEVFSWCKDNFLYEGINDFCGIFGGADSNISFYITWCLSISLIYLGFEVLMIFINLARSMIHSLTSKEF